MIVMRLSRIDSYRALQSVRQEDGYISVYLRRQKDGYISVYLKRQKGGYTSVYLKIPKIDMPHIAKYLKFKHKVYLLQIII